MMATYFHGGSEVQDNQRTHYAMNPNYSYIAAYSDSHNPNNNMLLFNAISQGSFPHAPPHPPPSQPFIAIPLSDNPACPSLPPPQHNLWRVGQDPSQRHGLSLSLSPQQKNTAAREVIVGSKYLKPAQELLDEVARAGVSGAEKGKEKGAAGGLGTAAGWGSGREVGESSGGSKVVAHPAQRQELQMKKTKLLNLLDEVEQRYRQYQSEMQALVSSFEQASGTGSAKSYTFLALRTISKQFRCLKDGISSEIKATNKSLGLGEDEDEHGDNKPIGSRLSLVDKQLRQQRALHQLGMMGPQHTAWRPQRGLPERAVSVLRAWLFEHFLHPYPKDSDKHMLARQTGLTRSQVSNWFINARVRLWKPMVEEMYSEEMKTKDHNDDRSTTNNDTTTAGNTVISPTKGDTTSSGQHQHDGVTKSPKKQKSNNSSSPSSIRNMNQVELKNPGYQSQAGPGEALSFNPVYLGGPYGTNGVSLTLGLNESGSIDEQGFLPNHESEMGRRVEVGADFWGIRMVHSSSNPISDNGFETIDIQSRKRFVAHQLLHDFVA